MGDQTASDMDGGWKQIIEDYLEAFFRFFFPKIHASINFDADYKFLDKELATDPSPFALASLIQLRKIQAGNDFQQQYQFKLSLIREMYSRGYARDDIIKLLRFIDYIMRLPDQLAVQLRREVEAIEEKFNMPYVTSFERLAKQEGIEEGIDCARTLLLQTIEIRFGQIPDELRASINACTSTDTLSNFHRQALLANSIDDLPKQLT